MNAKYCGLTADELYKALSQRMASGKSLQIALREEIEARYRPRVLPSGRIMTPISLAGPEVIYEDEHGRGSMPRTLWQAEAFADPSL